LAAGSKTDASNRTNRLVELKHVDVGWVHRSIDEDVSEGWNSLMTILANAPHEQIFKTDFIITLV